MKYIPWHLLVAAYNTTRSFQTLPWPTYATFQHLSLSSTHLPLSFTLSSLYFYACPCPAGLPLFWGAVSEGGSAEWALLLNFCAQILPLLVQGRLRCPSHPSSAGKSRTEAKHSIMSMCSGKTQRKLQENEGFLQACPLTFREWRYSGHEHIAPPAVAKHVVLWGQGSVTAMGDLHSTQCCCHSQANIFKNGSGIWSDGFSGTSNPPARQGQKHHPP